MNLRITRWSLFGTLVVLIILIILVAVFIDWNTVTQQLNQVNRSRLGVATVFLVFGYLVFAARWRFILANQIGFASAFHSSNACNLVNTLLPLRPGDAARIVIVSEKDRLPMLAITSSIVVERWFEQIMRLTAFGGAIIFGAGLQVSGLTMIGSAAFLGFSLIFMIWMVKKRQYVLEKFPPLLDRIPRITEEKAHHGLVSLIDGLIAVASIRRLSGILIWSIITWAFFWGFHYCSLLSLGQALTLQEQLALSLGSLALVPPSASTLPGVYQVSMVVPLTLVGLDENLLTSYAIVMNTVEILIIAGLGFWGMGQFGVSMRQLISKSIAVETDAA